MKENKIVKLSDVCDLIPGFAFKSSEFGEHKVKAVKIGDIQPPYVNFESMTGVDISKYSVSKLAKYEIFKGDFVLAMTGATIGKIGRYIADTGAYINQRVLKFKPHDAVNSDFIYYVVSSTSFQKYILNNVDSETAQPNISAGSVGKYEFELPSLEEQNRIANILASIDNKIQLNRQINDNLEQQAQALYKSWFVDFEPFKDGDFVESELGLIPDGWRCGLLSELLAIKYGKDHKKLSDGDIPVYGSGGIMRYVDTKLYEGEAVLIPRKGSLNNVMYVNEAFWTVDTMFYSTAKESNSGIYSYLFLTNKDLASMNAGSAVPSMTTDILNNLQLIIPPKEVLKSFNTLCFILFKCMKQNIIENMNLGNQRDSLLPKLMSGELKINEIEC